MPETPGIGAKFEYGETSAVYTSATGWTVVAEVTDLTPPEPETDDIETTSHDVTDAHRTFQAGLTDGGEAEVTTHYDKTVYATIEGLMRLDKKFRIRYSDGSAIGWAGYFKGHGTEVDIEGLTLMKFKTKVSGKPVPIASIT